MTTPLEQPPSDVPFVLACAFCEADSPDTFEEATRQGWIDIERADGFSWNFLGICPSCRPEWERPLPSGNLAELGEHVSAVADCNRVIELDPEDALAYWVRSEAK